MTEEAVEAEIVKDSCFPAKPKRVALGLKRSKHFEFYDTHLHIIPDKNGDVPWDDAEAEGRILFKLNELAEGSLQWWVGDYILFCEEKYGERFAQVVDAGLYSAKSIRNMLWVAKNVPQSNRWPPDKLSWSHHMVVASLEPESQRIALQKAFDEAWSVTELRLWLAGSSKPEKDATTYNAMYRASFIKRGALPEGIQEKPFMVEHRKRVLQEADVREVAGVDKDGSIDGGASGELSILELAIGKEIKPIKPTIDQDKLWKGWWAANEKVVQDEEDVETACQYVWNSAWAIARKVYEA
jgi:hypothetical protein